MNSKLTPVLELAEFGVSFGKRVVLDGITLSLTPGGIDVLMGPVKSGKSTLLRSLSCMYEGHLLHKCWGGAKLDGQVMTPSHHPALVQQHAKVFEQPLLDTLLGPVRATQKRSPAEWRAQALEWLTEYGLLEACEKLDKPLVHCSTRMQRSVLILAEVLLNPTILLIDEPTFELDEMEVTRLFVFLKKVAENCKILISLHNQTQARRIADKIVLIGGGRVLAHQDSVTFFTHPANEWVAQFVRTGSLSLPSLNAKPHHLEDSATPPPPLSSAARAVQAVRAAQALQAAGEAKSASVESPVLESAKYVPPVMAIKNALVVQDVDELVSSVGVEKRVPYEVWRGSPPPEPVAGAEDAPPVLLSTRPMFEKRPPIQEAPVRPSYLRQQTAVPLEVAVSKAPVQLPSPSIHGIELASMVGELLFRDNGAPRGFNWIVPGRLAGCPAPGVCAPIDYDMDMLVKVGITRLITLTENDLDQDVLHRHDLSNIHLPILDHEAPSIGQTHMLLVRMQKMLEAGEVVAVHCKAGLGRTGTILAAWLIRDGGLSADGAMTKLRRIEPGFIQSSIQEEFLHRYEADLTNRIL
jgi:atypical dual specificity phosphatase